MMQRFRRPATDTRRKVRFREMARGIVAKDRHDRKYGYAVDTAGAIARALEQAYRQGFDDAQIELPTAAAPTSTATDDGVLEWVMIPPRPRNAFWTICLFCLGRGRSDQPGGGGCVVPEVTERGTPGWRIVTSAHSDIKVIGEKTIKPLIRSGLLAVTEDGLVITDEGRATWERFLKRGGRFPDDLTSI
jgi:hypothetical protein